MSLVLQAKTRLEAAKIKAPGRIKTGIKNQTVENPAYGNGNSKPFYSGTPDGYDFGPQAANFAKVEKYLAKQKKKLVYVGVGKGTNSDNVRYSTFVAVDDVDNPTFVWQKLQTDTPGSSRNLFYTDGKMANVSTLPA